MFLNSMLIAVMFLSANINAQNIAASSYEKQFLKKKIQNQPPATSIEDLLEIINRESEFYKRQSELTRKDPSEREAWSDLYKNSKPFFQFIKNLASSSETASEVDENYKVALNAYYSILALKRKLLNPLYSVAEPLMPDPVS